MKLISKNIKETDKIAKTFVDKLGSQNKKQALLIGLYGDLGSGKTSFVKGVAKAFGIKNTVTSPTFVLEKIYKLPKDFSFKYLIHIDAYRLEGGKELLTLGWDDIFKNPQNIIFIEWPEKVADILPDDMMRIDFKFVNEETREIKIN